MRVAILVVAGCASAPRPVTPSSPAITCIRGCRLPPKVELQRLPFDVGVALTPASGRTLAVPPFECQREDGDECWVIATAAGRHQASRIELATPRSGTPIVLRLKWVSCDAYACVIDRGTLRLP